MEIEKSIQEFLTARREHPNLLAYRVFNKIDQCYTTKINVDSSIIDINKILNNPDYIFEQAIGVSDINNQPIFEGDITLLKLSLPFEPNNNLYCGIIYRTAFDGFRIFVPYLDQTYEFMSNIYVVGQFIRESDYFRFFVKQGGIYENISDKDSIKEILLSP